MSRKEFVGFGHLLHKYKGGKTISRANYTSTMQSVSQVWDVVVVGAGVAGSALAYAQGRV